MDTSPSKVGNDSNLVWTCFQLCLDLFVLYLARMWFRPCLDLISGIEATCIWNSFGLLNPNKVGNKSKHGWTHVQARLECTSPRYQFMKTMLFILHGFVIIWSCRYMVISFVFHYLVSMLACWVCSFIGHCFLII